MPSARHELYGVDAAPYIATTNAEVASALADAYARQDDAACQVLADLFRQLGVKIIVPTAHRPPTIRNLMADRVALAAAANLAAVPAPMRMSSRTAQKDAMVAKAVRVVKIPEGVNPAPTVIQQSGGLLAEAGTDGALVIIRTATGASMLAAAIPCRPRVSLHRNWIFPQLSLIFTAINYKPG